MIASTLQYSLAVIHDLFVKMTIRNANALLVCVTSFVYC